MMSMMAEELVPVGFIFAPTDSEMVTYYLQRMADGDQNLHGFIHSLDIYECEPWNLLPPDEFKYGISRNQAFFFTPRHPTGTITTAASSSGSNKHHARRTVRGGGGFWHGKAHEYHIRQLGESGPIVGRKTALNFKTRDGRPTDWIMQEYLLGSGGNTPFQSVALCKIYKKLHGRREIDDPQEPVVVGSKKQPQQADLQIAEVEADHDVLPPPCKKRRRLPRNHLQVDGFAKASTYKMPSSSSEDLITTSRGSGQQYAAAANDLLFSSFTQLLETEEEVEILPAEAAAAAYNQRLAGLAARLLGEEKEEEEMALPAAANELFASFTQLLERDKEEVGVLPAEAAADCSHVDERLASLAARLLGEEEEMALPAAANELFTSFNQLLDGDKKEEVVVVVPAAADNEEEPFHTLAGLFNDEDMLTLQYDDFGIDDYLCLEN